MKIGLDCHNLSTIPSKMLRTGIQQVVYNLLLAQYETRSALNAENIEIVPLPFLPKSYSRIPHRKIDINYINNSSIVLRQTSEELNIRPGDLWTNLVKDDYTLFSDDDFYSVAQNCDWIIITGLCDFRHVAYKLKLLNPKIKFAALIYDLIPILRPEVTVPGMEAWFDEKYLESIRLYADFIFTDSFHTASDCLNYAKKYIKTHTPIVSLTLPAETPCITENHLEYAHALLEKFKLKQRHYLICLGTIEPRKNVLAAIRGFSRLLKLFPQQYSDLKLVIIGKKGWNQEDSVLLNEIKSQEGQYIFPGYSSREEMECLVALSGGLIMSSRYEGFGLPLTLAEQFGLKTITCNNSSLPEASQLNAAFVPVDNPDEMALAIRNILQSNLHLPVSIRKPDHSWNIYLRNMVTNLQERENSAPHPPPEKISFLGKRKICIEVHNLSISYQELRKTGIQEVTFSIIRAAQNIRKKLSAEFELILLPVISFDRGSSFYNPTFSLPPKVLREVEKELGSSSFDIWGFDLKNINYEFSNYTFQNLVRGCSDFLITSQLETLQIYSSLKEVSPHANITSILYDLIPLLMPERVDKNLEQWFSHTYLKSILQCNTAVNCISRHSSLDMLGFTAKNNQALEVKSRLLPVCTPYEKQDKNIVEQLLKKQKLTAGKYFLIIGNTDPRKNVANAIKGYARFCSLNPELSQSYTFVMIGPHSWKTKDITEAFKEANKTSRTLNLGYVSDTILNSLVAISGGVIFPSRYEGFGIPISLAATHNVPIITCNNSSLPEASLAHAMYVHPDSIDEIALAFHAFAKKDCRPANYEKKDSWEEYLEDVIRML